MTLGRLPDWATWCAVLMEVLCGSPMTVRWTQTSGVGLYGDIAVQVMFVHTCHQVAEPPMLLHACRSKTHIILTKLLRSTTRWIVPWDRTICAFQDCLSNCSRSVWHCIHCKKIEATLWYSTVSKPPVRWDSDEALHRTSHSHFRILTASPSRSIATTKAILPIDQCHSVVTD